MADHYDVIIIGTGAGGGTLAHTLAPSGKRCCCSNGGAFLPREKENWEADPSSGRAATPRRTRGRTRTENRSNPGPLLRGGATKLYGAALYRMRPADLARSSTPTASPRLASHVRRLRAVVHESRVALPGPRDPWRRPDRGCLEPPIPAPARQPRAPHQADPRRPGEGRLPPLQRALRHPARREQPGDQRLHPLHLVRRLSRASCRPKPTPRRLPSSWRCNIPTSRCSWATR